MKAILISIQPKWVAKILNGEKTIEIRKTMPKCDLPVDVYIYCSKGKDMVCFRPNFDGYACVPNRYGNEYFNGKVVAKFTLDNWVKWKVHPEKEPDEEDKEILKLSCLSVKETIKYAAGKLIYGWYIDNLVIFDEPKGLWQFKTPENAEKYKRELEQAIIDDAKISARLYEDLANDDECANCVKLTELSEGYYGLQKPPQSWCYVEVL